MEDLMQQHRICFALASMLLALLFVPVASVAAQRQGRISGKVTDAKGEPIADVKVSITTKANSNFKKQLTTGRDGTFATFLNDATAAYHYRFEKPGFATVETDKKVPIWNPNDEGGVHPSSATMSVLDIQLAAQAPAVKH
jgi:hypothetical protein